MLYRAGLALASLSAEAERGGAGGPRARAGRRAALARLCDVRCDVRRLRRRARARGRNSVRVVAPLEVFTQTQTSAGHRGWALARATADHHARDTRALTAQRSGALPSISSSILAAPMSSTSSLAPPPLTPRRPRCHHVEQSAGGESPDRSPDTRQPREAAAHDTTARSRRHWVRSDRSHIDCAHRYQSSRPRSTRLRDRQQRRHALTILRERLRVATSARDMRSKA